MPRATAALRQAANLAVNSRTARQGTSLCATTRPRNCSRNGRPRRSGSARGVAKPVSNAIDVFALSSQKKLKSFEPYMVRPTSHQPMTAQQERKSAHACRQQRVTQSGRIPILIADVRAKRHFRHTCRQPCHQALSRRKRRGRARPAEPCAVVLRLPIGAPGHVCPYLRKAVRPHGATYSS